jgi:hypothetical protein
MMDYIKIVKSYLKPTVVQQSDSSMDYLKKMFRSVYSDPTVPPPATDAENNLNVVFSSKCLLFPH